MLDSRCIASGEVSPVNSAGVQPGQQATHIRHGQPPRLHHLTTHPDPAFTPHGIGKAIGLSAGAVANALDRLALLGQAVETCDRPRRFTAAAGTEPAAGTVHHTAAGPGARRIGEEITP
jgi:hypothetical protein